MELSLIHQRYRLCYAIGEGAMGQVWQAEDTLALEDVAIKQIRSELLEEETAYKRFERETELLHQLDHPNIMPLLDVFEEGDYYYIIMPLMAGSIFNLIELNGPLPVEWVRQIGLEVCDALKEAHRLGVIHRDIKSDNIMLDQNGIPVLTDFGVARFKSGTSMTHPGAVLGSIGYISPEVCTGNKATEASDIWSLGVVFYEMLTGEAPFQGRNLYAVMEAILHDPIPPIMQYDPNIPEEMTELLDAMLEKDPECRLSNVREVSDRLAQVPDTPTPPRLWPPTAPLAPSVSKQTV